MTTKKEDRATFLEIRKNELELKKQELAMREYERQKDIMFYMLSYDHLTIVQIERMKEMSGDQN